MNVKKVFSFLFLIAVFCVMYFLTPILFPVTAGLSLAGVMLNGPYGNYTGKVGGTIAAMWKGINYLKAYVVPANPNSVGQQAQRTKFKAVVLLAQSLIPTLITTFWNPFAVGMSGFNAFVKNIFPAVSSVGLIQVACQVVKGTLESTPILTATYNTGTGGIEVTWQGDTTGNGLPNDDLNCLILDKTTNAIIHYATGDAARSEESYATTIATGKTVGNLLCFAWFSRGTGVDFIVSNSDGHQMTA